MLNIISHQGNANLNHKEIPVQTAGQRAPEGPDLTLGQFFPVF